MTKTKPFIIDKRRVLQAYRLVKANRGAAGVDQESIKDFEKDLKNNLYKIWNRLSSGSYFPPPVKAVAIPKKSGGERVLSIPTVSDRIAQMVIKLEFEPQVEPYFLADSYGYRPNKSALDAVGVTRKRCWQSNWVLEFDIKGLFDNIPHDLLMKAVHIRGWLQYYGRYCPSAMYAMCRHVNKTLVRWAMWKFKGLRRHKIRASIFLQRIAAQNSNLFAHWKQMMVGVFV